MKWKWLCKWFGHKWTCYGFGNNGFFDYRKFRCIRCGVDILDKDEANKE